MEGKEVVGPTLIVQSTADTTVPETVTSEAVKRTCEVFRKSEIEYLRVKGVNTYATQRIWLRWVADRFAGRKVTVRLCDDSRLTVGHAPRPLNAYSLELKYCQGFANQGCQHG